MSVIWSFLIGSRLGRAILGMAVIAFFIAGFRIWLAAHDASVTAGARKGYVVQSELDAAAARAAKAEREARIASDMADAAQRQAETARTAEQLATDKLEKFIAQDTDDSGSRVTADDLRKLHDLRSTAQ